MNTIEIFNNFLKDCLVECSPTNKYDPETTLLFSDMPSYFIGMTSKIITKVLLFVTSHERQALKGVVRFNCFQFFEAFLE